MRTGTQGTLGGVYCDCYKVVTLTRFYAIPKCLNADYCDVFTVTFIACCIHDVATALSGLDTVFL